MEKLYFALKNEKPFVSLDKKTIELARKPIERMLEISKKLKII
jgi:quinolinate synthase